MANSGWIDGINNDGGTLSLFNRSVHIGIGRTTPIKSVNAIGDHEDLTTDRSLRPPFDQVAHGKVGTGGSTWIPKRQPERLGRLRVVGGRVLHDLYGAI